MDDMYFDDGDDEYFDEDEYQRRILQMAGGQYLHPPEPRQPFNEIYENCMKPILSLDRGTPIGQLMVLYGLCLVLLFTSCLAFLPRYFVPLTSIIFGSYLLFTPYGDDLTLIWVLYGFATLPYIFIGLFYTKRNSHFGIGVLCFTMIFLLQYFLSAKSFMRIRGILMVLTMKLFSVASDLQMGVVDKSPSFVDFYSYVIGVSTVIFGPWISYRQHENLISQKSFCTIWITLLKGSIFATISLGCLVHSQCFVEWLIPNDYEYYSSWLIAFRDAMSFRFSHYFVCYIAQASLYLSGYQATPIDMYENSMEAEKKPAESNQNGQNGTAENNKKENANRRDHSTQDDYFITKPWLIEFPRSLVDVVVNWNIPMHIWLKQYVFIPTKDAYGYFAAILATYAVSSLLHGFNFQISAVLLSLGFYTYAEHVLREKLAKSFQSCIRAKRCKAGCSHVYKKWNAVVICVNVGFFLLSVFHLAYLGMVFDSSSAQEGGYNITHTLEKWSQLHYSSHYVALGTFIFAKII